MIIATGRRFQKMSEHFSYLNDGSERLYEFLSKVNKYCVILCSAQKFGNRARSGTKSGVPQSDAVLQYRHWYVYWHCFIFSSFIRNNPIHSIPTIVTRENQLRSKQLAICFAIYSQKILKNSHKNYCRFWYPQEFLWTLHLRNHCKFFDIHVNKDYDVYLSLTFF